MIATKPSDLAWRPGPLPEPEPNLIVLVWVAGRLANHLEKAFASAALGDASLRWAIRDHIPIEEVGDVRWYAILRDEPYRGYVPLAARDDDTLGDLVERLRIEGGTIVSMADCDHIEILAARGRGDFWADRKGFGFVRRPPEEVVARA